MASVGASQAVSLPRVSSLAAHVEAGVVARLRNQPSPAAPAGESIQSLRERCRAAEESAKASAAEASRARAEVLRVRRVCQEMLDATALEILELKRELQARDRVALHPHSETSVSRAASCPPAVSRCVLGIDDEIPFDEIEAVLAASPACS